MSEGHANWRIGVGKPVPWADGQHTRGAVVAATSASIDQFRSFYASYMAAAARQPTWPRGYAFQTRLEGAFEAVPREMFLPPGPWHIEAGSGGYIETPNADVRFLYQDVLVAIDKNRGVNNGQPSGHAQFMGLLEPRPGETVVHIGAGTGYYSAILSILVAPGGRVAAFELNEDLALSARRNLQPLDNVSVTAGDATRAQLPEADVIYVNAGVIRPPVHWLMALSPGGRMFVPWRPAADIGIALFISRAAWGFRVNPAMPAWFIRCVGACNSSSGDKPPDIKGAWASRALYLKAEREPDATATAIYDELWFSSEWPS
jgi:protein-L-isoaspartate(D-aspartate) O-methyltransferase